MRLHCRWGMQPSPLVIGALLLASFVGAFSGVFLSTSWATQASPPHQLPAPVAPVVPAPVAPVVPSPVAPGQRQGSSSAPTGKDAWIKKVLAAFGGTGQGGAKGISAKDLNKALADPMLFNVWEHLQGFTGLSDAELRRRLSREGQYHFEAEHAIADPQSSSELAWYYSTSVAYLFANAIHPALDLGLRPEDAPVLDYSGGVGNNVIFWAQKGIKSVYFGIGMMEYAFAEYRVRRMGLEQMVTFLKPHHKNSSWLFDSRKVLAPNTYGTIVAMDVLEHVPRWQDTVKAMVQSLRDGGQIIECSPFSTNTAESGTDKDLRVHVGQGATSMTQAMGPGMRRIGTLQHINPTKLTACETVWRKLPHGESPKRGGGGGGG